MTLPEALSFAYDEIGVKLMVGAALQVESIVMHWSLRGQRGRRRRRRKSEGLV